jgi:hypothetical protein
MSTMKQVMPRPPRAGSEVANRMQKSARSASEMKVFRPLMIQLSPSRFAVVVMPAKSEPPPGSVNA